jgi:transcriptional regulator with XRE-family HTH domain
MRAIRQHFGARLKQLREEQQLRAPDVAALVGVDVSHIYNIEAGRTGPSFDLQVALAMVYKVDLADLFVFPDLHPRHAARELIRFTPSAKLDEVRAAIQRVNTPARPHRKTK